MRNQVEVNVANQIRDKLLKWFLKPVPEVTPEDVWALRNQLHALRHYSMRSGMGEKIGDDISAMLDAASSLWNILFDNREILDSVRDYHQVRSLDFNAGVLTEMEEIISGEESARDVLINSIAIFLGWKADTIWINSAWKDHKASVHKYLLEFQDHLWSFFNRESPRDGEPTLEKAENLARVMDGVSKLILRDDLPSVAQISILVRLFHLLLRLQIGNLIVKCSAQ